MALTGNEQLLVQGRAANGLPASVQFQTTTQEIADLGGGSGSAGPGIYNVLAYGAIGDGIVDDLTAIQDAVDAAELAGGGLVYFPQGTYVVSDEIVISEDYVGMYGTGIGSSIILASANGHGTLLVGSQSTSDNGKTVSNLLRDLSFHCTSGSTATNVTVFGVTRFMMERVEVYRGDTGMSLRNADQTTWEHNTFRTTGASSVAVELIQGNTDDVTTMDWTGGIVDVTGANSIGILFNDGTGVSANANEFNNINMSSFKLDGNNTAGTIGMQVIAGLRNVHGQNLEFKEWGLYSFDGATAMVTAYNNKSSFDSCKTLGDDDTTPTAHFYIAEQTGAKTTMMITNTQLSNALTAVLISNVGTKSPKVLLNFIESSNLTNFLESSDNTVTPNIGVGQTVLGGSVTNKVGTNLAGATSTTWEDHGTRSGSFLLYTQGTVTVTNPATTQAVSFSTALHFTPGARDIVITPTNSGSATTGPFWATSVTASGFTLNVGTTPGATATFQYKVKAS